MIGRLASLARIAPAALQRAADVFVSSVFWADSRVNSLLTPPWSGWTSVCDPLQEPLPTREDAGNAASRVILSWPCEVTHACPLPGEGGLTSCCHRTPFELPTTDRLTEIAAEVTCGRPEGAPDEADPGAHRRVP